MADDPKPAKRPIEFQSFERPELWTGDDFASFAQHIGYATWAWNALHAELCDLLWGLIGIEAPYIARAIWHAIKSDTGQRDVLKATAIAKLPKDDPHLAEILWLIEEVNQIAAFRNDSAHTLWTIEFNRRDAFAPKKAIPDIERGNPRGARLMGIDAGKRFNELAGYCMTLSAYARHLDGKVGILRVPEPEHPLPDRPQRPPSLLVQNPNKGNSPRPKRAKQPRPPKPSRA